MSRKEKRRNMKKIQLKKCISFAKIEYIKWICDARMCVAFIFLVFTYEFAVSPLLYNAALMGYEKINLLEPFIAVANSGAILLILPITFLFLIADFPKMDSDATLCILRTGRKNWLVGQMLRLALMIFTFLVLILMGTVLPVVTKCFVGSYWSDVVTKFHIMFPDKTANFGRLLLPENLYNQMSVPSAFLKSSLFLFLYLYTLGLILLFFSVLKRKMTGLVICGGIISLGAALCSIKTSFMWVLPMAHSIVWLHYTKYYREVPVPIWGSICYFLVLICAFTAASLVSVKRLEI